MVSSHVALALHANRAAKVITLMRPFAALVAADVAAAAASCCVGRDKDKLLQLQEARVSEAETCNWMGECK